MSSAPHSVSAVQLETVIITPQLSERPTRQVDFQKENAAFRELAGYFAQEPEKVLDRLVQLAIGLCEADTVGVSVEQTDDQGEKIFRWVAMAGELKHLIGGTTPRNFSPCGVCVDSNSPLLMEGLDRFYPYFKEAPLPFVEALLVPWGVQDVAVGTLWIVTHSERHKFDRDDLRLMSCLAAFAAGAFRLKENLLRTERTNAAVQVVSSMAHHINNPLQGAVSALHLAKHQIEQGQDAHEMIAIAEAELQRVVVLSAELIGKWHS